MLKWLKQFFWIFFFWQLGQIISFFSCGFYSGDVIGMFLIFFALFSGILKNNHVDRVSRLMLKYMPLFTIPLIIGFVPYFQSISSYLGVIIVAYLVSTVVVMVAVGFLVNFLIKTKKK